ncbi:MAG: hypothetical protein DRJ49_04240 [Thermoprotei archaeon]|mgnify:CR=1 FL=1|nr:MAG: hypothetical protein DRJ49_04240 [Thermoprotei archaeon]
MRRDTLNIPRVLLAESLKEFKECYGSCAEALLWHLGKILGKKYFEMLKEEGREPRDFRTAVKRLEELGIGVFSINTVDGELGIKSSELAETGNFITFIPGIISGFLSAVFGVNINVPALSMTNNIVIRIEKEVRLYRRSSV